MTINASGRRGVAEFVTGKTLVASGRSRVCQ